MGDSKSCCPMLSDRRLDFESGVLASAHLEQRLTQLAMRRVKIERRAARLAVEQHRGDRRAQVAVRATMGDAVVANACAAAAT